MYYALVQSEVLAAVTIKNTTFLDSQPCILTDIYRYPTGMLCLRLQSKRGLFCPEN